MSSNERFFELFQDIEDSIKECGKEMPDDLGGYDKIVQDRINKHCAEKVKPASKRKGVDFSDLNRLIEKMGDQAREPIEKCSCEYCGKPMTPVESELVCKNCGFRC